MWKLGRTVLLGFTLCAVGTPHVQAANRVALVIGNDAYKQISVLEKAVNDSRAISTALKAIGFTVLSGENLSRRDMNLHLQRFSAQLGPGDEALFFFAGHGVEIQGRNYLLPTDIPKAVPGQEAFVATEAIAADDVLTRIRSRGTRVSILVLDACRDNPFPRKGTRSVGSTRGFARMPAPEGSFIMYSAGVGQTALDRLDPSDPDPNSVFTRSLIPLIKQPGLSLHEMARQVRRKVQKLAGTIAHDQRPAYYDEVTGDFFFKAGRTISLPADSLGKSATTHAERLWSIIKDTKDEAVLEAFLEQHPTGTFAALARARLKELAGTDVAVGVHPNSQQPEPPPRHKPGDSFEDCDGCPQMVALPAGDFLMGSPANQNDRDKDEGPRHRVRIATPFAVARYEVTVDQFAAFVNETGHQTSGGCEVFDARKKTFEKRASNAFRNPGFPQTGGHPAACVSWQDAKAYVAWLAKKSNKPYRLLTEAEWEYAARAGSKTRFSFGDNPADACRYANGPNETSCNDGVGDRTAKTGSYLPNEFKLHDMHGNVWEWVEDCHHKTYDGSPSDGSAWVSGGDCSKRMLRGGSWDRDYTVTTLRSANRAWGPVGMRHSTIGFRVARVLEN